MRHPYSLGGVVRFGLASLLVAAASLGGRGAQAADQLVAFNDVFTILPGGDGGLETFHHRIDSKPTEPASWLAPVDYAHGTAYIHIEVLKKPSARNTKLVICFDGEKAAYGCIDTLRYTAPGTYDQKVEMTTTWQWNQIKWGSRRGQYHIVVKEGSSDAQGGKPASDFAPTTVRLAMTIVPQGGMYVPPPFGDPSADAGAGAADAGADDAPAPGGSGGAAGGSGGAAGGASGSSGGSSGSSGGSSGSGASSGGASGSGGTPAVGSGGTGPDTKGGSSGTSSGGSSGGGAKGGSGGASSPPAGSGDNGGSPSSGGCAVTGSAGRGAGSSLILLLGIVLGRSLAGRRRRS